MRQHRLTNGRHIMKLYINDNGEISCAKHGGFDLAASVEAQPTARTYWTPRGTWQVATSADRFAFEAIIKAPMTCETCAEELVRA